jgi:hypothetical protein
VARAFACAGILGVLGAAPSEAQQGGSRHPSTRAGARLTAAELGAIRAPPTREVAVRLYERALVLDSTFALAHAALSATNCRTGFARTGA